MSFVRRPGACVAPVQTRLRPPPTKSNRHESPPFILFGLVMGLVARAVMMPGRQSMGLLATALVGMAGSFVGGLVATL